MQSIEDLRRRDPVKRAILAGAGLAAMMLVWVTSLMVERISSKGDLATLDQRIQSGSKDYRQVLDNEQNLLNTRKKLQALQQLSTNRFLIGNLLEVLQKSAVDDVQLTRFKIDQSYVLFAGTKAESGAPGAEAAPATPAKPATATEKIAIVITAKDAGSVPGDSIGRYQSALSKNTYLRSLIKNGTNDFRLTTSLTPQADQDGRPYVAFTLEARLPDKTR